MVDGLRRLHATPRWHGTFHFENSWGTRGPCRLSIRSRVCIDVFPSTSSVAEPLKQVSLAPFALVCPQPHRFSNGDTTDDLLPRSIVALGDAAGLAQGDCTTALLCRNAHDPHYEFIGGRPRLLGGFRIDYFERAAVRVIVPKQRTCRHQNIAWVPSHRYSVGVHHSPMGALAGHKLAGSRAAGACVNCIVRRHFLRAGGGSRGATPLVGAPLAKNLARTPVTLKLGDERAKPLIDA